MKILLLGKNGQIGFELQRTLAPLGEVISFDQDRASFLDIVALRQTVKGCSPNVIVNAAAYTAVDKAETDEAVCHAVNAAAPAVLAEEARRLNALLIHYSSDYVFNGKKSDPYLEDDEAFPLSVYARSKVEGDRLVAQSGADFLIIRTGWVYGARGANFLRTILRLAKERSELGIVNDQIGAPTWSRMIAEGTAQAIARAAVNPAEYSGVYHLTAAGRTTWFGFTEAIFDIFNLQPRPKLVPITMDQYPTPAKRPAYSVLSTDKFARAFGLRLPDWRRQLEMVAGEVMSDQISLAASR